MQLAQFADDPELASADLIYVLDSPQQKEELLELRGRPLPDLPLPVPGRGDGGERRLRGREQRRRERSRAAGCCCCSTPTSCPTAPGWLGKMRDFYDATPDIGALCPKLLYEDDSIQHAGSYFYQLPGSEKWVDAHYFKGMHRSLPAANVARARAGRLGRLHDGRPRALRGARRPAAASTCRATTRTRTSACSYGSADATNWYLPEAELYHLEGQSYTPGRAPAREPLQHVAAHAPLGRADRRADGERSSRRVDGAPSPH